MTPENVLLGVTLLCYFAGSVLYHAHLFTGSERAQRIATWLLPVGLTLHTAGIGVWCTHYGRLLQDPGMPYSLIAYLLVLAQVGLNFLPRWAALGSLSMPLAFIAQFYANMRAAGTTVENLAGGPLMRPHVTAILLGFAAFALAFCLAITYLVQSRLLKTKQISGLFRRLPPLESVSNAAHWLATVGFSMLTLGIITGSMAAPERWGPNWYLDARIVTSLVAWAIYAAYLGVSLFLGWRGRRTTYFLIAGFLVVLIAFVASLGHPNSAKRLSGPEAGLTLVAYRGNNSPT